VGPRAGLDLWYCSDASCPGIINIDQELDPSRPLPSDVAGRSAQAIFERERKDQIDRYFRALPILGTFGGLLALTGFFSASAFLPMIWAALVGVCFSVGTMLVGLRMAPEIVRWREGAIGEQKVGDRLAVLTDYVCLYDRRIVGRGGNIDALAIGPPGIFVIEVKRWRGSVEVVNGRLQVRGRDNPEVVGRTLELAQMVQAALATDLNRHRLQAVPVLCFVDKRVEGAARAGGVHVVNDSDLPRRLRAEPAALAPDEIQGLARAADHALPPSDW